jgi:hypothetical protein
LAAAAGEHITRELAQLLPKVGLVVGDFFQEELDIPVLQVPLKELEVAAEVAY